MGVRAARTPARWFQPAAAVKAAVRPPLPPDEAGDFGTSAITGSFAACRLATLPSSGAVSCLTAEGAAGVGGGRAGSLTGGVPDAAVRSVLAAVRSLLAYSCRTQGAERAESASSRQVEASCWC